MDYSEIKNLSLKSFIGFLILTAVIAILTVISGEIGDIQGRILGTTLTISIASICSMSCAAFIEKRHFKPPGITGIVFSLLSAALVIIEIWATVSTSLYTKITVAVVISAFSFAHALLLFLPKLDEKKEWIQKVMAVTVAILAIQIIASVWYDIENQLYFRVMTVIAILVGLETLVIPILMKLSDRDVDDDEKEILKLKKVKGDLYKDSSGKLYEVTEKN